MAIKGQSPQELEHQANRVRAELGSTAQALRNSLTPSHLFAEAKESSGFDQLTPEGAFDFAVRRHPLPTLMVGVGLGVWAYAATRRKTEAQDLELGTLASSGPDPDRPGKIAEAVSSLAETATKTFQDQAERKAAELKIFAETQVKSGAEYVTGAIDRTVDDLVARIPGAPPGTRRVLASAAQVILMTALKALLPKYARRGSEVP